MVCDGDGDCAMVIVLWCVSKLFYCFLFCCFVFLFFVWLPYLYPFRYTHLVSLCRCVAVSRCRGFIRPNQAHGSLGGLEGLAGARARAEFGVLEDELPSLLSSPSRHCFAHCKALG